MIEVRELRSGDLDAVVSLLDQLGEVTSTGSPVEAHSVHRTYELMVRFPDVYKNYVAVEHSRIVGLISLVFYKTLLHEGGTALINELVVSGRERGRGIGAQLVKAGIAAAREYGMDQIEVGTESGNRDAHHFYKHIGFNLEYVLFGMEF
jgi:GNAT superfamily N-acetyltransferase